ncbi:MAG: hypothetical protein KAX33_00920 [Candidatus Lokiarchaeota archaeon]|nr:hypothetical protein [Candidatus Lokiarchaeota archaeon]MCK4281138.1 hypothetical protein [Candidatus Lokiarchaeota archaeon]
MSMFRSYLLKQNFWAKKGKERTVYMKHDINIGGIYAKIEKNRGVTLFIKGKDYFFDNFDNLDVFLNRLTNSSNNDDFSRVLKRRNMQKALRTLAI